MIDFSREDPVPLAEVATLFRVTTQTVRKWTKRRTAPLEYKRVGGGLYTSRNAIQRFSGEPEQMAPVQVPRGHDEAVRLLQQEYGIQ